MNKNKEETSEDDKRLQEELLRLAEILMNTSQNDESFASSLGELGRLIKTSTSSITAVPKPLKYLRDSYEGLKNSYERMKDRKRTQAGSSCDQLLTDFADIVSVLAMVGSKPGSRECLQYRLKGSTKNPAEWGHEYLRQLETDIMEVCLTAPVENETEIKERLMPLLESIVSFDVKHNAEMQACDLCLEIDQLDVLERQLDETNFRRICSYIENCAAYSEETERERILNRIAMHYLRFGDYSKATLIGLQLGNLELMEKCLIECPDSLTRKQLAFILARKKQKQPEIAIIQKEGVDGREDAKTIEMILSNSLLNFHFQTFCRELDILEPKHPDEIYKSWLVTGLPTRLLITHYDSARANLATSFVSGFVNAGFGHDKLISKTKDSWIYKNKDHGMFSATAALGLIHMWDVDGGLASIDKYLYSANDFIKSGALLAIGLVNCGVRNECDPALALLENYLSSNSETLKIGAIMGLGIAYAGSQHRVVSDHLSQVLVKESNLEVASVAAICVGLVNVGSTNPEASTCILQKLLELSPLELANTYARFLPLGLGIIYMGRRDAVETLSTALEVLPDPFKLAAQIMLQVCSYAGTGDVLIVQELLRICSEPTNSSSNFGGIPANTDASFETNENSPNAPKRPRNESEPTTSSQSSSSMQTSDGYRQIGPAQAIASLGVAAVALGGGKENSRIFGQVARYGSPDARRAVPLATALSSLSNPECSLVDLLNKYSHDDDPEVVHNATLALGLVGAGTNNARLAAMLRQLATYHATEPANLFLVRISQGLVHLGKGTLSLCPLRYDSKVLDYTALAAIMVVLVACLDCKNLILGRSHYLLYCLAIAMEPRWLMTLDENLQALPALVRIGQYVDATGKAGNPKIIRTNREQTTPILLASDERAELVDDSSQPLSSVLEGFVILRKKSD